MMDKSDLMTIAGGMDVLGSDGGKVGTVADARQDYVVVSKGFFFPSDYYIPAIAIGTVTDDTVHLAVTKDEALDQDWKNEPVAARTVMENEPIPKRGLPHENPVDTNDFDPFEVDDEIERDLTTGRPLTNQ